MNPQWHTAEAVRRFARHGRSMSCGIFPRLRLALAINAFIPPFSLGRLRVAVLRLGGVRLGARTTVGGRFHVAGGSQPAQSLVVGADCFINEGCWFDTSAPITVGNDVYLAHEVAVITSSHQIGSSSRRAYGSILAPVAIGAGTWVGARATILPGVTIGRGVVVAAGSMVTRSVGDDVLVAGVPARVLRQLDPEGEVNASSG